ncbi:tRNA lysidine(34) synthetase TilS [Halopseudomonas pachastrellae]|nr:tRNA lysidine(34) synthetase TilS [Halopseudomonas pachastrellae]
MGAPAWWLGLSGGLDSMVLLELMSQARQLSDIPPLHAIHVHHGLHPEADAWAAHCQRACDVRGVPLTVVRVQVVQGGSVEEAARDARYAAFADMLAPGAELLLAHHRDDQLETLMFRLMRGTGVRGLSGMPARRALGAGWLSRPLLDWRRSELEAWARQQGLDWIEDPANADERFAVRPCGTGFCPDCVMSGRSWIAVCCAWPSMPVRPVRCWMSWRRMTCSWWRNPVLIRGWPAGRACCWRRC